jgi:hypothetical protein
MFDFYANDVQAIFLVISLCAMGVVIVTLVGVAGLSVLKAARHES